LGIKIEQDEKNMSNQNIERIPLGLLQLDKQNPRLPSKLKNVATSESEIMNWMLGDASIIELMLAIGNAGFFIGEALLVVESAKGKYIVVEGNRRLTSLKLLIDPTIAEIHKKKIEQVLLGRVDLCCT
jgi:hypothetical protein